MNERRRMWEHDRHRMVYRPSMISLLAGLLIAAAPADGYIGEEPAPTPAQAAPEAAEPGSAPTAGESEAKAAPAATDPAAAPLANPPPAELPEATASQAPKPAAPRQRLEILANDARMEAYEQFRSLYETARFDQALPLAKRVVELSESDPERDHELPIAYNNLGATQYQLGDYPAAELSYRKSLELLEATTGISSRRLVVPLAGLGAVYAAKDEHQVAAELFDRALAVSRRSDGLFNLEQLPLIEQAADSRYAMSDFGGAEREHLYALKIAEQNYGFGDERTLPLLIDLASFYESLREFIASRMMYMRARDIAMKKDGFNPLAIKALNGIARSYRLQYTMDPETLESQQQTRDEITGETIGKTYKESSRELLSTSDRSGLKAAQAALELLRSTPNPPPDLMTETLLELGDWYQATSRPALSIPYYAEAASIFEARLAEDPLAGNPLKAPRMVFYRPPLSASRGLNTLSGQYVVRKTVFSFLVSDTGEPQGIEVVSTDMDEDQLSLSRRALAKAVYSPRYSDGKPVSTAGVTFTSEWYEERDPAKAVPPTATPVSTQPAEPASAPGTR